jgi:L-alanine-DL-glutamate epimerase-like enolase superfamily enzyme
LPAESYCLAVRIFFFEEEPLPYRDPAAYAELWASTSIPVAGGECLTTFEEFKQYADLGSFDIGQPDASFIGIGAFLKVASLFGERSGGSPPTPGEPAAR